MLAREFCVVNGELSDLCWLMNTLISLYFSNSTSVDSFNPFELIRKDKGDKAESPTQPPVQ